MNNQLKDLKQKHRSLLLALEHLKTTITTTAPPGAPPSATGRASQNLSQNHLGLLQKYQTDELKFDSVGGGASGDGGSLEKSVRVLSDEIDEDINFQYFALESPANDYFDRMNQELNKDLLVPHSIDN